MGCLCVLMLGSQVLKEKFDRVECQCGGLVCCMWKWRGDKGGDVVGEGTCMSVCQLFLVMRESGEEYV